jgi:hypothetical protein
VGVQEQADQDACVFEVVAGPLAQAYTPGVRFVGLRTVAFGGLNCLD